MFLIYFLEKKKRKQFSCNLIFNFSIVLCMDDNFCLHSNKNTWCSVKANQSSLFLEILMMPSIKDLIINKCSAQNGTHNGMTPKDAGHVILNLFNLWEPCTELTFESLESQAKQDRGAPYRVRNRRACTCKSPSSHCCLMGLLASAFPPHSTGPEVAILSLRGEPRNGSVALASYRWQLQSCLLSSCSQDQKYVFHIHPFVPLCS